MASPAAKWLNAEAESVGRVKVDGKLAVPNLRNVFVIGDAAASTAWRSMPVPGLAPAAKQGGAHIARLITAGVLGRPDPGPFVYRHLGSLATIGRKSAVADFGRIRVGGAPAGWRWGLLHLLFFGVAPHPLPLVPTSVWSPF